MLDGAATPAPRGRREHGAVVGEHGGGVAVLGSGTVEGLHDVGGTRREPRVRTHQEAGAVVQGVQDVDLGPARQGPSLPSASL